MSLPSADKARKTADKAVSKTAVKQRKKDLSHRHSVLRLEGICRHSIMSSSVTGAYECRVGVSLYASEVVDEVIEALSTEGYGIAVDPIDYTLTIDWTTDI